MKLIGLDIGTTSICGVVLDTEIGNVVLRTTHANRSGVRCTDDFAHLQDPSEILNSIETVLDTLLSEHPDTAAIGISSQMHGILYINGSGEHVSPLYTWQDARGDKILSGSQSYCDAFQEQTGYAISAGYGMVTHFYNLINHLVPAEAVSFCTIGDYVAMNLAGSSEPITEPTLASSLGSFDIEEGCFDTAALRNLFITSDFLPRIASSGTPLGKFRGTITVFNAIGDNQASYLGAVRSKQDSLLINIGTGAQLSVMTNTMCTVPHWETRPAVGEGYLLVGATPNGGNAYVLIEGFFRRVLDVFNASLQGSLFDKMNAVLQNVYEKDNQLKVSTQFYGARDNPQKRGAIQNITPENFTPVDLMVGTLSGVVDELVSFYEDLPVELRSKVRHVVGSGNGIRKNNYLKSLLERKFSTTLEIATCDEEAAFGAALYAAGASSVFSSSADLLKCIRYEGDI
ncbi:sedoheptulokinase [Alicyclobacillus dauci]|uniref:FGGY family carbohydrate kinase n=1 Tax=Alicyclobacillus dauci TaxID=1475485 RepID=A0ABY6Z2J3_9BACL|nr:FGGY family carbohydrate kinase [Alicyclobacillus dauci]WAH37051.1 FGGY family carbohydrate kinase [Alicyclobacillus dauci]